MIRVIKRSIAILVILLILLMNIYAVGSSAYGATQHMFDLAGYMYDDDLGYVDAYLTELSEELQFDIVGVISYDGLSGDDQMRYADDFYDYGGFGYGSGNDGCIFVVDMKSRQMMLVTTGYGTEAVTDYGEEVLYDYVQDSLSEGDFVTAFTEKYADTISDYVNMARDGSAVDTNSPGHDGYDWYEEPENGVGGFSGAEAAAGAGGISALIGVIAGFFSSQRQKSKLKTVRRKTQANSYARRDSLVLTRKHDRFLYSTLAVTPRPKHNNNDHDRHHGGGGTTIHMGSSGVPHGGGRGRGF